jgi:hypothetical protein
VATNDDELRRQWRKMFDAVQVAPEYVMARFEIGYLPALIHAATTPPEGKKTASTKAARELCVAVAYCLEHDIPMPVPLRAWLFAGMQAGMAGRSVDAALKLKRGAGQKKTEDPMAVIERERRIAVRLFGLKFMEGLTDAQAKEIVCEESGLDTRRVEQIWQEHCPSPDGVARLREWQAAMRDLMERAPETRTGAYSAWLAEVIELAREMK